MLAEKGKAFDELKTERLRLQRLTLAGSSMYHRSLLVRIRLGRHELGWKAWSRFQFARTEETLRGSLT